MGTIQAFEDFSRSERVSIIGDSRGRVASQKSNLSEKLHDLQVRNARLEASMI